MLNRRPLVPFLLLFFSILPIYSQNKTIDSIETILANRKISDTTRINTIIAGMDNTIMLSKPHVAYFNQLLPVFTKGLAMPKLHPKVKRKYQFAAGVYYYNTAKKETSEGNKNAPIHFDEAIKYWKESKDYKPMALAIVGKGAYYRHIADWPNTFKYFFEALKFYESINNENGISTVNMEIGTACIAQQDWNKAIVHLKKALPYFDVPESELRKSDRHSLAVIHNNIGTSYTRLKNFTEAHNHFLKAYYYIKKNKDPQAESIILVQLAQSSSELGKLAESEDYLKRALELCNDDISKQGVYGSAARINYKNKNYDKAAEYGELSYSLAKKNKNINSQSGITSLLYKIYKESGQYEKSLKMHEANIVIKDSTNLEASKNELAQQELKYQFEKKELQQKILQQKKLAAVTLEQQKKVTAVKLEAQKKAALETSKNKLAQQQLVYDFEKKQLNQKLAQGKKVAAIKLDSEKKTAVKNNWLIAVSSVFLLFLLGAYFYYRNNKQKQAITVLEKNQIKQKLLITQMNPHFIFNSVQNIESLIDNKQNDEAVVYLGKFSKLTRQILENSNENYISLEEELEMIENYLSIQQLLYENKFKFTILVEKEIDTESIFLPPMLAQPFIENAIKHGLSNTLENGKIAIHFYLKENKLFFEVTDNGKGFGTSTQSSSHKSLAMTITKERLVSYTKNKDFIVQTDNLIASNGMIEGAKVVFEIPYIYES